MPYASVVPAIRTPYGVEVFDYRVVAEQDIRPGDVIRVPFRKRLTPGLVVAVSPTSEFAARAVDLPVTRPLVRLPATVIPLLDRASAHAFCSRPTILHSWIREVPKRERGGLENTAPVGSISYSGIDITRLTVDRRSSILEAANNHPGRTLILTPWKSRAERLAVELQAPFLHADVASGAAWNAWTQFSTAPTGILVATRIGAWLAALADTVIVDEPENDDYKQDELTPRLDARWLIERAVEYRPHLAVMKIGTTPGLESMNEPDSIPSIPSISLPVAYDPWPGGGRSPIEGMTNGALAKIHEALENKRPVVILHPIAGERGRIVCRDCAWSASCAACGFNLSREASDARCRRCGRRQPLPEHCPQCGGADLNKSRPGRDRLATQVTKHLVGDIRVLDLPDWHRSSLPRNALVLVTDLSLIGGFTEDIRRRERLVVAWRRLAASVALAGGSLFVQGPEELLNQAPLWLTPEGLVATWQEEHRDRNAFKYPPAARVVKLLFDENEEAATTRLAELQSTLPQGWDVRGPFPVAHRSRTRTPRVAFHLLPPDDCDDEALQRHLEPLAKAAIIDLDPIAFFS